MVIFLLQMVLWEVTDDLVRDKSDRNLKSHGSCSLECWSLLLLTFGWLRSSSGWVKRVYLIAGSEKASALCWARGNKASNQVRVPGSGAFLCPPTSVNSKAIKGSLHKSCLHRFPPPSSFEKLSFENIPVKLVKSSRGFLSEQLPPPRFPPSFLQSSLLQARSVCV